MPIELIVLLIIFLPLFSLACFQDNKNLLGILCLASFLFVGVWLYISLNTPYRVVRQELKPIEVIGNIQTISYLDENENPKIIDLKTQFGMVLPKETLIRVTVLDKSMYSGIIYGYIQDKFEVVFSEKNH